MLDVDRIVRRSFGHLDRGRPPLLCELLFGPAAGDDDPGTGFLGFAGLADFLQGFLERRHADPVDLGAERQRGADTVNVAVGQPGNDGAAAEIDQLGLVISEFLHRGRCA